MWRFFVAKLQQLPPTTIRYKYQACRFSILYTEVIRKIVQLVDLPASQGNALSIRLFVYRSLSFGDTPS